MSLVNVKITDGAISVNMSTPLVTVLRDTQNPLIQVRFLKNRNIATWRVLYRNRWHKVGTWPETKTRDIRHGFGALINKIANNEQAKAVKDCFTNVGDLLTWYEQRKSDDANLSEQRKKDIASAIKCHLLPRLAQAKFEELTHDFIDKKFVWPLQKQLAKGTVAKLFRTLKSAFYDALKLHMIITNPLIGIKISDFGDFISKVKGTRLQTYMVQPLLDELTEQPKIIKVIVMLMLTTGTRIGETRQAQWQHFDLSNKGVWVIPAAFTKTKKAHTITLPMVVIGLLLAWKAHQASAKYNGVYLFPNFIGKAALSANEASRLVHRFSFGEWSSHDLRKCARRCWAEQGVDFMVGERMLNHGLGKVAEAYLDTKISTLCLTALTTHSQWLSKQNKNSYILNPSSTPSG